MATREAMIAPDHAILDRLPHRPPFRFLSSVVSLNPGCDAQGRWCVTGDEPYFAGHFPSHPVIPGVLIAESLAQLSGLIVFSPQGKGDESSPSNAGSCLPDEPGHRPAAHLAHVDLRLRSAVSPPADLTLHSRLTRTFGALWQFEVKALVAERDVARGQLVLARTAEIGEVS